MKLYTSDFDLDETARRDQSTQMQRSNILKKQIIFDPEMDPTFWSYTKLL